MRCHAQKQGLGINTKMPVAEGEGFVGQAFGKVYGQCL